VVEMGVEFIDATPALRVAGKTRLLHGPRDVNHLNAEGYQVLAHAIQSTPRAR